MEEEGEEEEGPTAPVIEDSLSEGSVISDADDDADGEGSEESEPETSLQGDEEPTAVQNGHNHKSEAIASKPTPKSAGPPFVNANLDTEVMMNGLNISDANKAEEVHFDDLGRQRTTPAPPRDQNQPRETLIERRRKEHEEYRKKRDADPAFVPNRGGFFMHDHRSAGPSQNGFRPFPRTAGRGQGAFRGTFTGPRYVILWAINKSYANI